MNSKLDIPDTSLLLSVKGLQNRLGIGRDLAYSLMHASGFPAIKIGSRYFVTEDALEKWLRRYEGREFVI